MFILGIESSCDDTSVALLDCSSKGCFVIKEFTASQIEIHQKYGGVVPEVAGRMHAEKIVPLIEEILKGQPTPEAIAVTSGPGLITGLIVGVEAARTLAWAKNIPIISVNHIAGHVHAAEVNSEPLTYPALALVASGGHTELILVNSPQEYKMLGATADDAAGECFDKAAKMLKLPYPGGPKISQLATSGRTTAIDFPRPMIKSHDYNFSFAGLKTAALYWLRDHRILKNNWVTKLLKKLKIRVITINDFCASFEQAIIDVLIAKTVRAAEEAKPTAVILCGGVAANKKLRNELAQALKSKNIPLRVPDIKYCMDNAAMIAAAGYAQANKKDFATWQNLKANPNWELGRQ